MKKNKEKRYKKCGGSFSQHGLVKTFSILSLLCLVLVFSLGLVSFADNAVSTEKESYRPFLNPLGVLTTTPTLNDEVFFSYTPTYSLANSSSTNSVSTSFGSHNFDIGLVYDNFYLQDNNLLSISASSGTILFEDFSFYWFGDQIGYSYIEFPLENPSSVTLIAEYTLIYYDINSDSDYHLNYIDITEELIYNEDEEVFTLLAPSIGTYSQTYGLIGVYNYVITFSGIQADDSIFYIETPYLIKENADIDRFYLWYIDEFQIEPPTNNVNFLSALFNGVSDALSVPLFGTFSLGGILFAVFAVLCVIAFLKIYAGG